jgi:hypothetical protein
MNAVQGDGGARRPGHGRASRVERPCASTIDDSMWCRLSARASAHCGGVTVLGTITGAKVFSATRAKEREELGDSITRWLRANPGLEIVDKIVTQSSDQEFHCLTITLFYRDVAA